MSVALNFVRIGHHLTVLGHCCHIFKMKLTGYIDYYDQWTQKNIWGLKIYIATLTDWLVLYSGIMLLTVM